MGNIFQRKTPTQSFSVQDDREAMDQILELSEQKMNEGDYLKISECLKVIHESKQHNIVPTYRILTRSMIEPNSLYRLTRDETIQLMRSRYKDYCEFCIIKLEEFIAEDQIRLRQTTKDKKEAWTRFKNDNTDETRKKHKELVRNEKILKTRINERIMGIQKNEMLLDEFKMGNYGTIHL
jgi:hypothetical protein